MESKVSVVGLFLIVVKVGLLCSTEAYVFVVGGKDGWVRTPSEGYNQWAGRYRFQVKDSLLFKFPKGADSVLVVTSDDYVTCNTKSPLVSLTDGQSLFTFDRSGPFFFISGNSDNCNNGQKMIVIVLAERNKIPTTPPPPPANPPSPAKVPPPAAPSPAKSPEPAGVTPSGTNETQVPAPSPQSGSAGSVSGSGVVVLGLSGIVSYLILGKGNLV